jgi:hypothetical protein
MNAVQSHQRNAMATVTTAPLFFYHILSVERTCHYMRVHNLETVVGRTTTARLLGSALCCASHPRTLGQSSVTRCGGLGKTSITTTTTTSTGFTATLLRRQRRCRIHTARLQEPNLVLMRVERVVLLHQSSFVNKNSITTKDTSHIFGNL